MKVKATEFAQLGEQAQSERAADLNRSGASPAVGQAAIKEKIASFEEEHDMSSEDMVEAVSEGEMRESAAISKWLTLLDALRDSQRAVR
jgi:hypothetical protein